jgi:hypothetical protein
MSDLDVIATVVLSVSAGSGIISGLFALHYFHAETEADRLWVFWPIFALVGGGVFIVCLVVLVWL